jgi:hypothetical protein
VACQIVSFRRQQTAVRRAAQQAAGMSASQFGLDLVNFFGRQGTQVKPNNSSVGDGRFQTTQWSAVLLSAQSEAPGSRAALADLCKLYWYPIYAFVRR